MDTSGPPDEKNVNIYRIYRRSDVEKQQIELVRKKIDPKNEFIDQIDFEISYYVIHLTDVQRGTTPFFNPVDENFEHLTLWLLGDGRHLSYCLKLKSHLEVKEPAYQKLFEVGPRVNVVTPKSTNITNIFKAVGIHHIIRFEVSRRYLITLKHGVEFDWNKLDILYDPMVEQVYTDSIVNEFLANTSIKDVPHTWNEVPLGEDPYEALKKASDDLGLGFDEQDIEMYKEYYRSQNRSPTDIELMDLAQSNSEHSRHWLFNGRYIIDGVPEETSLFDLVKSTNDRLYTNSNNVIKFSDNSSAITGFHADMLMTTDHIQMPSYKRERKMMDIIFTAETHNFPTAIEPFNGAATGTGGRIRDVQAAGRGANVVAGTAGYCTGNLFIPDYDLPWEVKRSYNKDFASPLSIMLSASDGASDYGNKFGEPIIQGFARTYGDIIGSSEENERREWVKPIMFTGGVGTILDRHSKKMKSKPGMIVAKIGGPAYKIGLGGGVASSIQVQGDNKSSRDFNAVQRGDPEMEQKMNRVIRRCIECEKNPIVSIHDQGAGGNANVLKEILEDTGGIIFAREFTKGDPSMSMLELWISEYQESNAILVFPNFLMKLQEYAKRERCILDSVGVANDSMRLQLHHDHYDEEIIQKISSSNAALPNLPVSIDLQQKLGNIRKIFKWTKKRIEPSPLTLPTFLLEKNEKDKVYEALQRVLRLPSVGSKRFLTNKVDRSVTGLIAQQQCVGPLHTPLADVAVTATSYFATNGAAISIGEQPIKILVDPAAGARMTVAEALTNIVAAPITELKDIKCSGNWMWPGKTDSEGWQLYAACKSMCDIMKIFGIAIDGGKDSMSMSARVHNEDESSSVVKSPGQLVVSAYAPCRNVTKIVTPDIKGPNRNESTYLIWVQAVPDQHRIGGCAVAQVFNTIGNTCPDLNESQAKEMVSTFELLQNLIQDGDIESIHDVSDGGVLTCLVEMALGGWTGLKIKISADMNLFKPIDVLFAEEAGWVLEVKGSKVGEIKEEFKELNVLFQVIGQPTTQGPAAKFEVSINEDIMINMELLELSKIWEETSYRLEDQQKLNNMAFEEYNSFSKRKNIEYKVSFNYNKEKTIARITIPSVGIIREEGTNGDREMAAALFDAGFYVHDITTTDLFSSNVSLKDIKGIVFPGGFSFADVLGSAKGWAAVLEGDVKIKRKLTEWKNEKTFSFGVCNGCQLMAHLGWVGPPTNYVIEQKKNDEYKMRRFTSDVVLETNKSGRFESRWSYVKIPKTSSILLKDMEESVLGVWVSNTEGNFVFKNDIVKKLIVDSNLIALKYVDEDHNPTESYPLNPSGSQDGIAGLVSDCGRHLAVMPHPERSYLQWQWPYLSNLQPHKYSPWFKIFLNAFEWCIKN